MKEFLFLRVNLSCLNQAAKKMKTLKFKTNINCTTCMFTAKPYLDKIHNVMGWEVDINDPEKVLTVKGDHVDTKNVIDMVQQAGYKAEEKKGMLGKIFG
jgi:copper chaperone